MKRTLTILLTLTLVLAVLSGCAASQPPSESDDISTSLSKHTTKENRTSLQLPSKYLSEEGGVYTLTLPQSQQALTLRDTEVRYVPYITDTLVEEAEKKITEDVAEYKESPRFSLDVWEGYLCLYEEIIAPLTPPEGATDLGCGIDHDHVIFRERISDQAM